MLNLCTDYYKVSIGNYFCALCGEFSALKKIKCLPVGNEANRRACEKITNSIAQTKGDEQYDDIVSEFIEVNNEMNFIYLLMKIFNIKGDLPPVLSEKARGKGLFTEDLFDPFKADTRVRQLSVKRKIALSGLNEQKNASLQNRQPLTKFTLANQIAAINHAGEGGRGGISLKSSVAEYFSELNYLEKLAKNKRDV